MIYKMTEDGNGIAIDANGLPIVIDEKEGKEFGLDAIHLFSKVPALQEEAKNHRLKAKDASEKLAAFGDLDPSKALEAMQLTANLSAGDLTKKDEVEKIKQATEEAWRLRFETEKTVHSNVVSDLQKQINAIEGDVRKSILSSQFARSPHFTGKEPTTILTPEIAEAYFGRHFKVEKSDKGDRIAIGYLGENAIYSKKRPGEPADFDEAMDIIIETYPMKDRILQKSLGSGGTGSGGSYREPTIMKGDQAAFSDNLEAIAAGKVKVV